MKLILNAKINIDDLYHNTHPTLLHNQTQYYFFPAVFSVAVSSEALL